MNERIQQALDGEIDPIRLSTPERDELRQAESDFAAVVGAIPMTPLPDLAPAVLARIRSEALQQKRVVVVLADRTRKSSVVQWLWKPRPVSFGWRPAYALAATLLIAVLISGQVIRSNRAATTSASQVFTRFVLSVPNANTVALAGDFTGWQPTYTMTQSGPALWTVVVPLEPGVHTYAFVVDGQRWIADPMAPAVDDGFGGSNSRVAVLTPDTRGL
jgi:hypothetical protein